MTRVFMSSLVGDSVLSQQRDCSYQSIVAGETLLTYSRSLMNCSSFGSTVPPDMGSNAPCEIEEPLVNYCLLWNWSGREDLNLRPPGPEDWFHEESTL